MKPLNKKVIIQPDKAKEMSEGGLYIPDQAKDRPVTGTIITAADDCDFVKTGQRVMYGKYAGTAINLDELDDAILLNEKEILGIIEDENVQDSEN